MDKVSNTRVGTISCRSTSRRTRIETTKSEVDTDWIGRLADQHPEEQGLKHEVSISYPTKEYELADQHPEEQGLKHVMLLLVALWLLILPINIQKNKD